jgi:hypothetical protein
MMPRIFLGQGGAICLGQRSAQSSKVEFEDEEEEEEEEDEFQFVFQAMLSALERGPRPLRKEATFSPRSPELHCCECDPR